MNGSGKAEIPRLLTVPVLTHPGRCLATALQVQLSEKVMNMRLCSCHPYVEVTSDIFVAHSRNDHLHDLRFAPCERRRRGGGVMSAVGIAPNGETSQQAGGHACRASLLASPDVNQEWNNVGEAGSFWNIACGASLGPGNNFLCRFGHSGHDNRNVRGNGSDLSNGRGAIWERLVKQDDVGLMIDNSRQGFPQVGEKT